MAGATPKIILTCAVTGAIHTPTMSDALPITPQQIAAQSVEAARAGAAILHLHTRNPATGEPSPDVGLYREALAGITGQTDAICNITTGGSPRMTVEDRLAAPLDLSPEMCSLNMGTMNFALYPMADRYTDWKHAWEEPYLRGSDDYIFRNTFRDIATIYRRLGEDHGTRFEHECYDVGHLYNLAHCIDRGMFRPPFFIQFVLGILGGIGASSDNLLFLKQTADRLFGDDYRWSVLGAGRHQMPLATQALLLGGNIRVGLEDSLMIGRGRMAASNAEQVAKVRGIVESLGFEIASPDEARAMLGLKGRAAVAF